MQLLWKMWPEYEPCHPLPSNFSPERQKHHLSWELQAQQVLNLPRNCADYFHLSTWRRLFLSTVFLIMEKRESHAFNLLYYLRCNFPVACAIFIFVFFPSIFLCTSNVSVYSKAPLKACFPKCDQSERYLFHLIFNSLVLLRSSSGPGWTTRPTTCWLLETIVRVSQCDAQDV